MNTGIEKPFEILLNEKYFKKGDILYNGGMKVKVTNTPVWRYRGWFWKILNFFFPQRFIEAVTYKVKVIGFEGESTLCICKKGSYLKGAKNNPQVK